MKCKFMFNVTLLYALHKHICYNKLRYNILFKKIMVKMKSGLKVLRAKKDITQKELALATGINLRFISDLENNKFQRLDRKMLEKLSLFFGKCPIQDIVYFEFDDNTKELVS